MATLFQPFEIDYGTYDDLISEERRKNADTLKKLINSSITLGTKTITRRICKEIPFTETEFLRLFKDARKSTTAIKSSSTFNYKFRKQLYTKNFNSVKDATLKELFGPQWFIKKHKTSFAVIVKIGFTLIKETITTFETVQDISKLRVIIPGTLEKEETILVRFSGMVCYGSLWQEEADGWQKEVESLIELYSKKNK